MKEDYNLVCYLNRNLNYFRDEEYEDWYSGKEKGVSYTEYFEHLIPYGQYQIKSEKDIDYLGTGLKILHEKKSLSILRRNDFINLVSEFFKVYGWSVYLLKKIHNLGTNVLIEKRVDIVGYIKCFLMIRKISFERKIGAKEFHELESLIYESRSSKGAIITTGGLTQGALKFVQKQSDRIFYFDNQTFENNLLKLSVVNSLKKNV